MPQQDQFHDGQSCESLARNVPIATAALAAVTTHGLTTEGAEGEEKGRRGNEREREEIGEGLREKGEEEFWA